MQPGAHLQRKRHRTLATARELAENLLLLEQEAQVHVLRVEAYGVDADRGQLAPVHHVAQATLGDPDETGCLCG